MAKVKGNSNCVNVVIFGEGRKQKIDNIESLIISSTLREEIWS